MSSRCSPCFGDTAQFSRRCNEGEVVSSPPRAVLQGSETLVTTEEALARCRDTRAVTANVHSGSARCRHASICAQLEARTLWRRLLAPRLLGKFSAPPAAFPTAVLCWRRPDCEAFARSARGHDQLVSPGLSCHQQTVMRARLCSMELDSRQGAEHRNNEDTPCNVWRRDKHNSPRSTF